MLLPIAIIAVSDPDERNFMIMVYEEYHHVMFATGYSILHNKELAEDVVSAVLVKLIEKIKTVMKIDPRALRSYIVSATKNTALNLSEQKARELRTQTVFADETENEVQASDNVEYVILRTETIQGMADALECLRPRDREILRMKYYDEMTDQEIAEVIGTKSSTVRMSLTRARNRLMQICRERDIEL